MFESIKNKIKNFEPLTKNSYGRSWNEKSGNNQLDWYTKMHNSCLYLYPVLPIPILGLFQTIQLSILILLSLKDFSIIEYALNPIHQ